MCSNESGFEFNVTEVVVSSPKSKSITLVCFTIRTFMRALAAVISESASFKVRLTM
ncbi:MAG TPA: hypothetical protein VFU83_03165 [Pyrinomonadaceae bacterium]|nr:hypothetical protein [Pyrinomonadaceae bacterium]